MTPTPTWRTVVTAWHEHPAARQALARRLRNTEHDAIYWETSPSLTGDEPFADVVLPAPVLAQTTANSAAFRNRLLAPVVSFDNLGGDSRLVVPSRPRKSAHLLEFLRHADADDVDLFFAMVAEEVLQWWSDPSRGPLWLSTHGTGVPWLHVRLDPRPKYYRSSLGQRTIAS